LPGQDDAPAQPLNIEEDPTLARSSGNQQSPLEVAQSATAGFRTIGADRANEVPADLAHHPRYRVQELLGAGGMGAVYKAEHRLMHRTVALKVINPGLVASKSAVQRFQREVQAAARLHHANIVTAHDAEQAGDVHFLVMEFVKGTDLGKVLAERGPLPVAEACDYIRQAALGLQHAMENGMVHRDIKPQNLMITPANQVKILDFGLASLTADPDTLQADQKSQVENQKSGLTLAGALMGTPDYMAPEQASDARSADIRSDIYSLGCTLYCLLTGKAPFPGGTTMDKVIAHAERKPAPVHELRKDMPAELVKVLDKMMAKSPAARYQTPAEVAAALLPFTAGGPAVRQRPPRRRFAMLMGAAAVLLLAGIIFITTDNGQLKIDCKVDDVQVVVSKGGKEYEVIDLKSGTTVKRLPAGAYTISLKDEQTDVKLDKGGFTMTRWDRPL